MSVVSRLQARRWELAAGVVITAVVVGIPWISNGGLSGGGSGASAAATTTTTAPGGSPSVLGASIDANGQPVAAAGPGDDFLSLLQNISAPPTTVTTSTAPPTTGSPAPSPVTTTTTTARPTTTSTTTAKPPPTPRAPTGLVLDFSGTALAARWDAVTVESNGSPFTGGYEVTVESGAITRTYPQNGTTFTYSVDQNRADFGTAQAELTIAVRAVDTAGAAGAPATGVAAHQPPATPTAAPILAPGTGEITVIGQLPAGATDIAGFDIYEYQPGAPTPYVFLGSTTGIGAYVDAGLAAGSTHTYVYRTRDVFGQTSAGYSPAATATAS